MLADNIVNVINLETNSIGVCHFLPIVSSYSALHSTSYMRPKLQTLSRTSYS